MGSVHPLQMLSAFETRQARDIVLASHPNDVLEFRTLALREPDKNVLMPYLELEHSGQLSQMTKRPARVAECHYDTISSDRSIQYHISLVDVELGSVIKHTAVSKEFCPSLTM